MTLQEFNEKEWTFGELMQTIYEYDLRAGDNILTSEAFNDFVDESISEWIDNMSWYDIYSMLFEYEEYTNYDYYELDGYELVHTHDYEDKSGFTHIKDAVREEMECKDLFDPETVHKNENDNNNHNEFMDDLIEFVNSSIKSLEIGTESNVDDDISDKIASFCS